MLVRRPCTPTGLSICGTVATLRQRWRKPFPILPTAFPPMTTTLVNTGFIDYHSFGLNEDELLSLRSLSAIWRLAIERAAQRFGDDSALKDFVGATNELPHKISDPAWQTAWLHAWHKLSGRGFTMAAMFSLFNYAVGYAEAELFGDRPQVSRIELHLFGILRRCVVAAISCAIELGEEARSAEAGLPGEFAALRCLRDYAASGRPAALLSVSMAKHKSFAHLTAAELDSIPALLTDQLTRLLRDDDQVFGGREGEWLLLLPDVRSMAQPVLAASQIRRAFADPLTLLSGRGLMLDVAIGAAMMPDHGTDASEIIQAARLARLGVRDEGERFAMFDDSIRRAWDQRLMLSRELSLALRNDCLQLYLQPQVDLQTEHCFGAELLLRWQRSNGDWVPPPVIVDIIDENGWRADFTNWLLRAAMRLGAELSIAGIPVTLSLNLTAGDLLDADLPELVRQILASWREPAPRYTFELMESALMIDRERGLGVMNRLRDLGIKLALEDCGTGYSSLSYLASLPLHEIKIDRSFVVGMVVSEESRRIVKTIVDLTRDLGMYPLAEGGEDASQCEQLLALGCSKVQGYFYAKPMPPDAFVTWY